MVQLLIVDDEPSVLEGLALGIPWRELRVGEIFKAGSAKQAIEILDKNSIALLITDIRMPGMSGLELIAQARKSSARTKCILLTGHSDFEYAQRAISLSADDYLLKPVSDEALTAACRKAIDAYDEEWREIVSVRKARELLRDNLPYLRGRFLAEILEEGLPAERSLDRHLEDLEIPVRRGDRIAVMAIRIEDGFPEYARDNESMVEYAVLRIVDELFRDGTAAWRCRDGSNYLVLVVKDAARDSIDHLGLQLQKNVKQYLKGNVSIVASDWGTFPDELPRLYARSISAMRRTIGNDNRIYVSLRKGERPQNATSLLLLYEPPELYRLMEAGRWEDAEAKIEGIYDELTERWPNSREHAMEVAACIAGAFSRIAHADGRLLSEILEEDQVDILDSRSFRTIGRMRDWAKRAARSVRRAMEKEIRDTRSDLIKKVSSYIDGNLHSDVSLQGIADFLNLHPAYVSRIYKLETGENLSAYILKRRMEKAAYLLRSTELKILEISAETGYPNPAYFIKVFKSEFGMTPVEYREGAGAAPSSPDESRP